MGRLKAGITLGTDRDAMLALLSGVEWEIRASAMRNGTATLFF
jgi:hypothetical protein